MCVFFLCINVKNFSFINPSDHDGQMVTVIDTPTLWYQKPNIDPKKPA